MISEPDNPSRAGDSPLTVLPGHAEIADSPEPPAGVPASRADAQLHARVSELEARLADLTGCLVDAERRAAEVLAIRAQTDVLHREHAALGAAHTLLEQQLAASGAAHTLLEQQLAASRQSEHALQYEAQKLHAVITSRSWRVTAPLRAGMRELRGLLGR